MNPTTDADRYTRVLRNRIDSDLEELQDKITVYRAVLDAGLLPDRRYAHGITAAAQHFAEDAAAYEAWTTALKTVTQHDS